MTSSRNMIIVGFCLFLSLSLPAYADDPRFASTGGPVVTSSPGFNAVANALLASGPVAALVVGLFLDATVPSSPGERGLAAWHAHDGGGAVDWWRVPHVEAVYGLPWGLSVKVGKAKERARARVRATARRAWRALRRRKGSEAGDDAQA